MSVSQAQVLVPRARARFEASLRALLTARTGMESCSQLAAIMPGWDGQLDALLRKRIDRHAGHCENCRERGRYELDPAMLLGLLPAAVPPAGLRDQLFDLAGDADANGHADADRFGVANGFGVTKCPGEHPRPVAVAGGPDADRGRVGTLTARGGWAPPPDPGPGPPA